MKTITYTLLPFLLQTHLITSIPISTQTLDQSITHAQTLQHLPVSSPHIFTTNPNIQKLLTSILNSRNKTSNPNQIHYENPVQYIAENVDESLLQASQILNTMEENAVALEDSIRDHPLNKTQQEDMLQSAFNEIQEAENGENNGGGEGILGASG